MAKKSMIETAYDIIKERNDKISFQELCQEVCKRLGMTEEELGAKAGAFYTSLTLDGRLITLGNNVWDLRNRYKFEQVHIDMNDVYTEEPEDSEEGDEKVAELGQEKDEGNAPTVSDDDDDDDDDSSVNSASSQAKSEIDSINGDN